MFEIQNNNIKLLSPTKKQYLVTLYHLQNQILPIITNSYKEEKAVVYDKIVPELKKIRVEVVVKKFQKDVIIDDEYMSKLKDKLELGESIEINGWVLSTYDRVPKELKKIPV